MKTGDIVFLDKAKYGERPFRIEKINTATYLLNPLDGGAEGAGQQGAGAGPSPHAG